MLDLRQVCNTRVILLAAISFAHTAGAEVEAHNEQPSSLPRGEPLIVEVSFNHENRGVYPIIITQEGDYLLRGDDLRATGVVPPYGTPVVIGGEEYFSIGRIGATSINLDENRLALSANLPPQRWPKQSADLIARRTPQLVYPHDNSAYLNYRLLKTGNDYGAVDTWSLGGEVGVRFSDTLFRSESAYVRQGDAWQRIRYGTSVTRDNRDTLQRLIVGDFITSSGNLGNTLSLGGISFSKSYAIDPYYVKQPTAGFVSTISSPSNVDIYLDGARIQSDTLQPGEFELKNLNYFGGRHDLEVVIRDAFGREQRVAYPYYFSDQNLRQGLHDYSYNIGRIRTGVGTSNDAYSDWAFSGYHRYGVSDDLTLGMRGEAEAAVHNFGPSAAMRLDRWGVLSGAISKSSSDHGTGWAGSAGYGYQIQRFNLQGSVRRYTNSYEQIGLVANAYRPKQELIAAVGLPLREFGSLGLSVRNQSNYQGTDQKTVSLTYSRSLYHQFNLMVVLGRTTMAETSNYAYITLNYNPGPSFNSLFTHQQNSSNYSDTVQVGNTTPVGEGLGYRFTADRAVTESGESIRLSPWAQYNSRHAIYMANVQSFTQANGNTQTAYQWGISGGIAYVADTVSLTRPVYDSFALVDVGGLEGVRVSSNSQLIGRTDKSGQILLPNVGSYLANRISVNDHDVPIDYTLKSKVINISPPLHSGSLIRFDVKQLRALLGRLLVKIGNEWEAAKYSQLTLEVDGKKITVPTSRAGEFYLENVSAGNYRAQIKSQGRSCDFELMVPKSREAMIEMGEVKSCEMVH